MRNSQPSSVAAHRLQVRNNELGERNREGLPVAPCLNTRKEVDTETLDFQDLCSIGQS
jgi:hypothetical protein